MATKLTSFVFSKKSGSSAKSEALKQYLDGECWGLVEGEDFNTKPLTVKGNLKRLAKKLGKKIQISITKDKETGKAMVVVQAMIVKPTDINEPDPNFVPGNTAEAPVVEATKPATNGGTVPADQKVVPPTPSPKKGKK